MNLYTTAKLALESRVINPSRRIWFGYKWLGIPLTGAVGECVPVTPLDSGDGRTRFATLKGEWIDLPPDEVLLHTSEVTHFAESWLQK